MFAENIQILSKSDAILRRYMRKTDKLEAKNRLYSRARMA